MSNQIAIKAHTQPGDEMICDVNCHIYNYEAGGAGVDPGPDPPREDRRAPHRHGVRLGEVRPARHDGRPHGAGSRAGRLRHRAAEPAPTPGGADLHRGVERGDTVGQVVAEFRGIRQDHRLAGA